MKKKAYVNTSGTEEGSKRGLKVRKVGTTGFVTARRALSGCPIPVHDMLYSAAMLKENGKILAAVLCGAYGSQ
jgi:hypothetical protein